MGEAAAVCFITVLHSIPAVLESGCKCLMYDEVVKFLARSTKLSAHNDMFVQMCFGKILCVSWDVFHRFLFGAGGRMK